jgi:uncharacterized membrane protein
MLPNKAQSSGKINCLLVVAYFVEAGFNPEEVTGFFLIYLIVLAALWSWDSLSSNRNECFTTL